MKIPHTIPKIILRTFEGEKTKKELKKQYRGRALRSEDTTWDKTVPPTLKQLCVDVVVKEYVFLVKFTEELNRLGKEKYEDDYNQWQADLAEYERRRMSYEEKLEEQLAWQREYLVLGNPDDPDDKDEDTDSDNDDDFRKQFEKPVPVSDNFGEYVAIKNVLDRLDDVDRIDVIEELDVKEIPLFIAIDTIPDEHYWERAVKDRWPSLDPYDHDNSWRQLYLERHLWECIETFHPFEDGMLSLIEQADLVAGLTKTLVVESIIPYCYGVLRESLVHVPHRADEEKIGEEDEGYDAPVEGEDISNKEPNTNIKKRAQARPKPPPPRVRKPLGGEEEEADKLLLEIKAKLEESELEEEVVEAIEDDYQEEEEEEMKEFARDSSHLDLSLVLPILKNLKKFTIVYEMVETGMEYEPRFFKFTDKDCIILARALSSCPSIEIFEFTRSQMNAEQCKVLVKEGLLNMPHLKVLNLSYQNIRNAGAKAIARLITDQSSRVCHTLQTLIMARNKIKNKGAKALAYALTLNKHLAELDIRLNMIEDRGGSDFGHALVKNGAIRSLNLAANRLTEKTAYVLGKMLKHNKTLLELDISSNDLERKGGEYIVRGVRVNKNILKVDLRLTKVGLDYEYDVDNFVKKNQFKHNFSLLLRERTFPSIAESQVFEEVEEEEVEEDINPEMDAEEEHGSESDDYDDVDEL